MKWEFAKTEDRTLFGGSVMALESFNEDGSIVREIIQNSLDAKREECDYVKVEIEISKQKTDLFPDKEGIEETIEACKSRFDYGTKDLNLLNDISESLENDEHYIVTFRDVNTRGLIGGLSDEDLETDLFQLIYADGTTNKNAKENSGGSFGIGKNAPFTRAGVRTIFYETRNIESNEYKIGKSLLVSHKINEENRVPRGYLENDPSIDKYLENIKLKDYGTAVHIPFYKISANKKKALNERIASEINRLIIDVLKNFMVAVVREKLEVEIIDNINPENSRIITKDGIEKIIKHLSTLSGNKDFINEIDHIKIQHNLLTNENAIVKEVPIDDDNYVEVFALLGEHSFGHKSVIYMRKQLMLIQDKKIKNGSIYKFDAMAIYQGVRINKVLREAEPPEHNKWIKKNIRNKEDREYYSNALMVAEKFLKEQFKSGNNEQIILKEFNNNLFDENKQMEDVFQVRKAKDKPISKKKKMGGTLTGEAEFANGTNKVKDKSKPKDKTTPSADGADANYIEVPNAVKKIRVNSNNEYVFTLTNNYNPDNMNIDIVVRTDNSKEETISSNDYKIVKNDGNKVVVKLKDKSQLDLGLVLEVK